MKLRDKVAVVTGGSQGIGLASAKAFAREGAQVFVTGRRAAELAKAVDEIGHGAIGVQADASKLDDINRLYAEVKAKAGRLDVLMLNAAHFEYADIEDITEAHFDRVYDTNVKGVFFAVQKALPMLGRGASVILVGSVASRTPMLSMLIYGSSKAAIRGLARGLVAETRGRGVRFNVLTPGATDTPGASNLTDEKKAAVARRIPLGRMAMPEDLATAAVFLASDDSAYITGIELDVDGGAAQI